MIKRREKKIQSKLISQLIQSRNKQKKKETTKNQSSIEKRILSVSVNQRGHIYHNAKQMKIANNFCVSVFFLLLLHSN